MAYRQLFAVTFAALGLVAMGCGGGESRGTSGTTTGDGQPPNNATDQAPNGTADQAPNSSDPAPSTATDTPPVNSQDPAGTGDSLSALCRRFCDKLVSDAQKCGDNVKVTNCGGADSCKVPPGVLPCAKQITDYVDCAIDNLNLVCGSVSGQGSGGSNGNAPLPPQQENPCKDQLSSYLKCAEAHGVGNDDQMTGDMPSGCYPAGGCKMCARDCDTCLCEAGTDTDKQAQCANRCPLTP